PLILFSAAVDYFVGARLVRTELAWKRRALLLVSLTLNLGLLGFFKYSPLIVKTLAPWLQAAGAFREAPSFGHWVVPVGISFYTFQTLSYTIDLYRRRIDPATSFRDFLLYVAFFPQLVAGPIVRASELLPQFKKRKRLHPEHIQQGIYCVVTGLCLKMVVADGVATAVNMLFDKAGEAAGASVAQTWIGVTAFSVQIYADFAGYSRIAIGLALLMGLRFPDNFHYPYISQSLSEFWTRWHITLSQWLRDYLYVPLGGNRKGRERTYANLMITMLLGGLWHGAAWTFAAWGLWHGFGLALERMLGLNESRRDRPAALQVPVRVLRIVLVWCFVTSGWVFFRARDFDTAWTILGTMWISPWTQGFGAWVDWRYTILLPLVFLPHAFQVMHEWYGWQKGRSGRVAIVIVSLLLLTFLRRIINQAFIYFQF
ncbi:MAG TPA: MBOAT family O-acyltransferase, partial [Planctomycetota bacterium]|nr:MBOAT family O-acyltransferase [Planctomycetota bacterium]